MSRNRPDLDRWSAEIAEANPSALSRAITLVESSRSEDWETASALIERLPEPRHPGFRLGVTGTPGVGKSTFIDAFGDLLCESGRRLAVLAVDPSSSVTGGAILGDRIHMERLNQRESVFLRSTASGNVPGGLALTTATVIRFCEVAGFDFVIVESVGVGQGELSIADVVDGLLLLIAPGGGDEIQGLKKGLLELADFILVSKADGDLLHQAEKTRDGYESSLGHEISSQRRASGRNRVGLMSARRPELIREMVAIILKFEEEIAATIPENRGTMRIREFESSLKKYLVDRIFAHPDVNTAAEEFGRGEFSRMHPLAVARRVVDSLLKCRDGETSSQSSRTE